MGGWTCFQGWLPKLPAEIEIVPLELPGRLSHPAPGLKPKSMQELAGMALDGLGRAFLQDRNFVFLGHSFGAWLVYEMTQELQRRREAADPSLKADQVWPLPLKVYVSANRAPQLASTGYDPDKITPRLSGLERGAFWEAFDRRYGKNPDLSTDYIKNMVQAQLVSDFRLLETYQPSTLRPLRVPLTALCAKGDGRVLPRQLSAWKKVAGRSFTERWFENVEKPEHWATVHRYVLDCPDSLIRFLRQDLPLVGTIVCEDAGIEGPLPPEGALAVVYDVFHFFHAFILKVLHFFARVLQLDSPKFD